MRVIFFPLTRFEHREPLKRAFEEAEALVARAMNDTQTSFTEPTLNYFSLTIILFPADSPQYEEVFDWKRKGRDLGVSKRIDFNDFMAADEGRRLGLVIGALHKACVELSEAHPVLGRLAEALRAHIAPEHLSSDVVPINPVYERPVKRIEVDLSGSADPAGNLELGQRIQDLLEKHGGQVVGFEVSATCIEFDVDDSAVPVAALAALLGSRFGASHVRLRDTDEASVWGSSP